METLLPNLVICGLKLMTRSTFQIPTLFQEQSALSGKVCAGLFCSAQRAPPSAGGHPGGSTVRRCRGSASCLVGACSCGARPPPEPPLPSPAPAAPQPRRECRSPAAAEGRVRPARGRVHGASSPRGGRVRGVSGACRGRVGGGSRRPKAPARRRPSRSASPARVPAAAAAAIGARAPGTKWPWERSGARAGPGARGPRRAGGRRRRRGKGRQRGREDEPEFQQISDSAVSGVQRGGSEE